MHRPALDFQAPEFIEVQQECLENLKKVMKTDAEVMIYAPSSHGSWEAAMTNICSPGDTVLMCETGLFSESWAEMCKALGLKVEVLENAWDNAVDPGRVEDRLRAANAGTIRVV